MKIVINGQSKEFSGTLSLRDLLRQISQESRHVITQVNGRIIKSANWDHTNLAEGDAVELVAIVGGG